MTKLSQISLDARTDRAMSRWAWVLAILIHASLLVIQLPEVAHTEPPLEICQLGGRQP